MKKIVIQIKVLKSDGALYDAIEPCEVNWTIPDEDGVTPDDFIQEEVNELYAAIRKLALS